MRFTAKSKEEIDAMGTIPAGTYEFRVADAKDKISKSGNEMIELNLEIYVQDGSSAFMFDYLLEAMPAKLYTFCESVGLLSVYYKGVLDAASLINRSGYAEVVIQKGTPNPQGGNYPDRNGIKKYIKAVGKNQESKSNSESLDHGFVDDDVPF